MQNNAIGCEGSQLEMQAVCTLAEYPQPSKRGQEALENPAGLQGICKVKTYFPNNTETFFFTLARVQGNFQQTMGYYDIAND